jgi:general secretion pathway protein M
MSQLQQQIRDWLDARQPQERMFLLVGAAVVLLALIYFAALGPFYRAIDARAERVAQKKQDLAWMRTASVEIRSQAANQAGAPAPTGESLVVLLDRTARESGLGSAVTGQTPMGTGGMRVELNGAPFDALVVWLGTLQQRYAVSTESASIARTDKPGLVNASLVLNRPSA